MIPEMDKLYKGSNAKLPFLTQLILDASAFLTKGPGGIITFIVLVFALIGFYYYRKTDSGRLLTDRLILKIPVFGSLITKSQIASFARTFSMLITAGVPILDSLKLVGDSTTNMLFKLEINDSRKKVEKGLPLSAPLMNSEAFPLLMGHMVKVGEETGKLDEVVSKVGEQYAKEVDQMASNLSRLMEPIILIVMGIVVGGLALAVYLPVLNLGSAIGG
jgi:type IV pilus assembly protein PilC